MNYPLIYFAVMPIAFVIAAFFTSDEDDLLERGFTVIVSMTLWPLVIIAIPIIIVVLLLMGFFSLFGWLAREITG